MQSLPHHKLVQVKSQLAWDGHLATEGERPPSLFQSLKEKQLFQDSYPLHSVWADVQLVGWPLQGCLLVRSEEQTNSSFWKPPGPRTHPIPGEPCCGSGC